MSISLNHTIVAATDPEKAARFLTELFDLPDPQPFGHFTVVKLSNGISLDYDTFPEPIHPQHYAFEVSDAEFDAIYTRISERGIEHWADPRSEKPGEINRRWGGRGVYFRDPSGHHMEILTHPPSL